MDNGCQRNRPPGKKSIETGRWPLNRQAMKEFTEVYGPQKETFEIPGLDSPEAQRIPNWMVYLIRSLEEEEARRIALSG
jgi:hypothetical protein